MTPRLLELFCGRGGWSKAFARKGWSCVGVDVAQLGYPYAFIQQDVRSLSPCFIDSFDAVVMSPPCEDFARAWLPWLRGDKLPQEWAVDLLRWSVCRADRPRRLVECSRFAARHVPGAWVRDSWALWGDVPLLLSSVPRGKTKRTGERPDLRAEIPPALSDGVADYFTAQMAEQFGRGLSLSA